MAKTPWPPINYCSPPKLFCFLIAIENKLFGRFKSFLKILVDIKHELPIKRQKQTHLITYQKSWSMNIEIDTNKNFLHFRSYSNQYIKNLVSFATLVIRDIIYWPYFSVPIRKNIFHFIKLEFDHLKFSKIWWYFESLFERKA